MPPLYLTFALMLCCFSSISAARVILSLFALNLGAQPSAVGILVATFYAFPLVLSWPVGVLSDRLGSRWLLLFGATCGACTQCCHCSREISAIIASPRHFRLNADGRRTQSNHIRDSVDCNSCCSYDFPPFFNVRFDQGSKLLGGRVRWVRTDVHKLLGKTRRLYRSGNFLVQDPDD